MTISIAWVRRNKDVTELVVASDSRLRSYGALDQAQKIFRLERNDCCLAFCGDTQIAYPLFIQVGSSVNNFIRSRTGAMDITELNDNIEKILNNLCQSWDADKKCKDEYLGETNIMLCGWSWKYSRFNIFVFKYKKGTFISHNKSDRLLPPWAEKNQSLTFIGDYKKEYFEHLSKVLENKYGTQPLQGNKRFSIPFDYEPIEALAELLKDGRSSGHFPSIGGAPQMLKIYPYGNDLPIVIRTNKSNHYLLGRKLFDWEKTTYPILDLTTADPKFIYPMSSIPLPKNLKHNPGSTLIGPDVSDS